MLHIVEISTQIDRYVSFQRRVILLSGAQIEKNFTVSSREESTVFQIKNGSLSQKELNG